MIEHDPVNGPYCGFVPTANTSLHNISMGTMQTLMGLNVGASIAQREAQAQMDYLEVMALNRLCRIKEHTLTSMVIAM